MTEQEAYDLLKKYKINQCTEAEKALVDDWFLQYNEDQPEFPKEIIEELGDEISKNLPSSDSRTKTIKLWSIIAAVAAVSLIGISILMFYQDREMTSIHDGVVQDITPGSNKATITLANGKVIKLSGTKTGIEVDAAKIKYNDGTKISGSNTDSFSGLATITTPKGGEYQIILSDGTKVWLNAASTLTFAASLRENGGEKRRVWLSGEAYFEVLKDKKQPFVVMTGHQEVLVLGTHFNINAYEPDSIRTTLSEGSVRVRSTKPNGISQKTILRPGEQAICSASATLVKKVDVDLELAWKNGNTEFENADLKIIMAMVERWYNVEVSYQGKPITTRFTGSVSRSRNISEILSFLESTGAVQFKIEGRRVIAMN